MRFVIGLLVAIAVALALVAAATRRFHRRIDGEARALLLGARAAPSPAVEASELGRLPPPVRRWLEASGAVERPRAATVRLKQQGAMRTAPDKPWSPFVAEQYFSVDPPGFVWGVDVKMMRVLPFSGRDLYLAGRGNMLIKAASLATVADGKGPEIDQGAMLRFLGEMIWFPSGVLSDYVTWEGIDDRHARATMRYGGVNASAVFEFDGSDRFVGLTADRFMSGAAPRLEKWQIRVTDWRTIRGIEIPVQGDVLWKLPEGDFDYFRFRISDLEANHPALYRDQPDALAESR